jgi:hypothetical protein
MNGENYCTGAGKLGQNLRICSSFILATDVVCEGKPVQQKEESITLDDETKEKFKRYFLDALENDTEVRRSVTNLIKYYLQEVIKAMASEGFLVKWENWKKR